MKEPVLPDPDLSKAEPKGPYPWSPYLTRSNITIGIVILVGLFFLFRPTEQPARHKSMGPDSPPVVKDSTRSQGTGVSNTEAGVGTPDNSGDRPPKIHSRYDYDRLNQDNDAGVGKREKNGGNDTASPQNAKRQRELEIAFDDNIVTQPHKMENQTAIANNQPQPTPKQEIAKKTAEENPFDYDHTAPVYYLPPTSILEAALDSKIEGEMNGPVDAHITEDIYYPGTNILLIPQGTKIQGEAQKVSNGDQKRLAITFHQLIFYPDPEDLKGRIYTMPLTSDPKGEQGLDDAGAAGVTGKVNNHALSLLAAAGVVGLLQGAQFSVYSSGGGYTPGTAIMTGEVGGASQVTSRILDRYLNRLPTITVPEGTRIKLEPVHPLKLIPYQKRHDDRKDAAPTTAMDGSPAKNFGDHSPPDSDQSRNASSDGRL